MTDQTDIAMAMDESCCPESDEVCRPMQNVVRIRALTDLTHRAFDLGPPALVAAACWVPAYGFSGIGAVAIAVLTMMIGGSVYRIMRRADYGEERTALADFVWRAGPLGLTLAFIGAGLGIKGSDEQFRLVTLLPLAGAGAWAMSPQIWLIRLNEWFAIRLQDASSWSCTTPCKGCIRSEQAPCRGRTGYRERRPSYRSAKSPRDT